MDTTAGVTRAGYVDGTVASTIATPTKRYGGLHTRKPANALPAECPTANIADASTQRCGVIAVTSALMNP